MCSPPPDSHLLDLGLQDAPKFWYLLKAVLAGGSDQAQGTTIQGLHREKPGKGLSESYCKGLKYHAHKFGINPVINF